jgi:acetyl-CoA carboxylase biotin carboxyl carrier protein
MDLQKIKALIDLATASGLSELELEEDGCRLRVSRGDAPSVIPAASTQPGPVAAADKKTAPGSVATTVDAEHSAFLNAPTFGVFCLTPAPKERPFVHVGDTVLKGQKLCMLEAMKQFRNVNADRDGKIAAILAEDGQEVDAGQPLFRFE